MTDMLRRQFNIFWVEAELKIAQAMQELEEEKGDLYGKDTRRADGKAQNPGQATGGPNYPTD